MSSYIIHMCVSNIVKRKFNLTDKFIYGSILPDSLKQITGDRDSTHYIEKVTIDGEIRELPNVKKAIQELDIQDNEMRLGYIAHLVEDYIWFNEFIPQFAKDLGQNKILYVQDNSIHTNEELKKDIYTDYSNVAEYVIKKCKVDIDTLVYNLMQLIQDEEQKKYLMQNMEYSKNVNMDKNNFMTTQALDEYIMKSVQQVERILLELIGE